MNTRFGLLGLMAVAIALATIETSDAADPKVTKGKIYAGYSSTNQMITVAPSGTFDIDSQVGEYQVVVDAGTVNNGKFLAWNGLAQYEQDVTTTDVGMTKPFGPPQPKAITNPPQGLLIRGRVRWRANTNDNWKWLGDEFTTPYTSVAAAQ
ncbi:MAG: hypothetical protein MUF18_01730 [Fimbriiglobus sp.]|jgi:hypothetical protein|nr:hypothetical protein [Fimbriiglobus sp.]